MPGNQDQKKLSNLAGKASKRTTIIDIANDTGYSIATVSRALNGFGRIKEKTKINVLAAAKRLDYIPNLMAQNLVNKQSNSIGLVVTENTQFYYEFYLYLRTLIASKGYNLIISYSNNDVKTQDFHLNRFLSLQVEGIIIAPVLEKIHFIETIKITKTPFVILNCVFIENEEKSITFDFKDGIKQAIDFLFKKGKKNFYQLARKEIYYGIERRNFFKFALESNGLAYDASKVFFVLDVIDDGYEKMMEILEKDNVVDAVICSSDYTALGALRALFDFGKKVPQEVALVGCYNTKLSQYSIPRLSSIKTNIKDIAEKSVEKLFFEMKTPNKSHQIELKTSFISRDTT